MPKRKREENEEKLKRKIKRYEEKLRSVKRKRKQRIIYSSEDEILEHDDDEHVRVADIHVPSPGNLDISEPDIFENIQPAGHDEPLEIQPAADMPLDLQPPIDVPVSNTSESHLDVDPEILKALGDYEVEDLEWGEELHEDIAKRFEQILANGLKKEAKEELVKKHLFSKNVTLSKGPTLNPEISAMLTEACKNRDKRLQSKQDQLGKALSAIGLAMSALLKKSPDLTSVVRILNDAGKLLSDSHYTETDTRRALITPLVDKALIEPFKNRKRDSLLFGEKLGDLVKDSLGIKRTGQYIQAPSSSASGSGLNWRGPPARGRQHQRSSQPYYPSRIGGQRTQYANYASRRRTAAAPPARRFAPAPPPPPPAPPPRRQTQAPARRRPPPDTASA